MAAHVLVVATVTAASDDLLAALDERVRKASVPVDFLLVMPASGPEAAEEMKPRLDVVLARWRDAGLKAEGLIGDSDPVNAVAEVWKPGRFDEVIVSTLPGQTSRWLRSDVPYRIGVLTDLPVTHVVAMSMAKPELHGEPPPRRERVPLGMLNVMAYRGNHPPEQGALKPW
jgi:GABA permease